MKILTDHRSLIAKLGGPSAVAEQLEIESINVRQWKARNRIPPEHWSRLIEVAQSAGNDGVNARWFLDTMPARKPATSDARAA